MFKFKVGDRVKVTQAYLKHYGMLDPGLDEVHVILRQKEIEGRRYYETTGGAFWEIDLEPLKSKEEQLIEKINQLYEKQKWVVGGKKEASSCTKQHAQSAERRVETDEETTSPCIRTDIPIVTPVGRVAEIQDANQRERALWRAILQYQREQEPGQQPSPNLSISISNLTTSR